MQSIDFCYWLRGFFELSGSEELTMGQVAMIKNHLNLVLIPVTEQVDLRKLGLLDEGEASSCAGPDLTVFCNQGEE